MSDRVCASCGGAATKRCGSCRRARYCGKGCQRDDWVAGHKHACQRGTRVDDGNLVHIDAVDKVVLLRELWEQAPLSHFFLTTPTAEKPTWDVSSAELSVHSYIDYFCGRPIKCDLSGDVVDSNQVSLYERFSGNDSFSRAFELAVLGTAKKRFPNGEEDAHNKIGALKLYFSEHFPKVTVENATEIPRDTQNTNLGWLSLEDEEFRPADMEQMFTLALTKFSSPETKEHAAFIPGGEKWFFGMPEDQIRACRDRDGTRPYVVHMYMW